MPAPAFTLSLTLLTVSSELAATSLGEPSLCLSSLLQELFSKFFLFLKLIVMFKWTYFDSSEFSGWALVGVAIPSGSSTAVEERTRDLLDAFLLCEFDALLFFFAVNLL